MNINKFLQSLHSTPTPAWEQKGGVVKPLILYPDVLLECEELVLQLADDPFEAKLRSNYEVTKQCY